MTEESTGAGKISLQTILGECIEYTCDFADFLYLI